MAAGLGFKDFVTGEVLTAADVDGYLMQGVWVFASAAARDAAVTSPQEGNFAYLKDTNVTTYYTGSAWANLDTTGMTNPMTTTGDTIYSSSGSTPARLGIGSTGNVLTVAGGVPTWAAPAGATFVGVNAYRNGTSLSVTANTAAFIPLTAELYDTDGFHDNSTNNERLTIPTGKGGKYLLSAVVRWSGAPTYFELNFWKNTSNNLQSGLDQGIQKFTQTAASVCITGSIVTELAAADYVRVAITQSNTGTDPLYCVFSATYLGA